MGIILGGYAFLFVCFIALAVITYVILDKRYRKNHGMDVPKGFEKTDEVSIDPGDGRRMRVYYNSRTGERFYHIEK